MSICISTLKDNAKENTVMLSNIIYSEQELIPLLKQRDEQSFKYLYDNYSSALYSIVLKIVPDREVASDVLQDVFMRIWQKIESYDPSKGRLFTWILNIARNLAIDMLRSKYYQNGRQTDSMDDDRYFNNNWMASHQNVDNIGLRKLIERLKPKHRALLDLAFFKGYTNSQIAEIENMPLGTVKTDIRNALVQVRFYLFRKDPLRENA